MAPVAGKPCRPFPARRPEEAAEAQRGWARIAGAPGAHPAAHSFPGRPGTHLHRAQAPPQIPRKCPPTARHPHLHGKIHPHPLGCQTARPALRPPGRRPDTLTTLRTAQDAQRRREHAANVPHAGRARALPPRRSRREKDGPAAKGQQPGPGGPETRRRSRCGCHSESRQRLASCPARPARVTPRGQGAGAEMPGAPHTVDAGRPVPTVQGKGRPKERPPPPPTEEGTYKLRTLNQ